MALSDGQTKYPLATLTKSRRDAAVLYELELHNRPDNRLTADFIGGSILPALDAIEADWRQDATNGGGAATLVTYGPRDKDRFYSNGLDLPKAMATPMFFPRMLNGLLGRFLTFPIPTVAAINGHCFAGGFTLALAHDYRIMKDLEGKGSIWCALNEIDFGAVIPAGMMAIATAKLTDQVALRTVALEGNRIGAKKALELNIVDGLGSSGQEVVDKAIQLGLNFAPKAKQQAWGLIKAAMYKQAIIELATDRGNDGLGMHNKLGAKL